MVYGLWLTVYGFQFSVAVFSEQFSVLLKKELNQDVQFCVSFACFRELVFSFQSQFSV